ncbi:hypothetical protein M758_8G007300 [Ceratodon purpureus]|uniref:Secreted protein n=1 Tax=Ceratodon purpureus TaxID=3225 RepID=A0A8T0GY19_CERPU|nr:hypothetical protein KC19_8G008000 [Ceratodon purpureus]KAG0607173.1 hypothetical protein M758_8G007300 [Ceratodon purpureus]
MIIYSILCHTWLLVFRQITYSGASVGAVANEISSCLTLSLYSHRHCLSNLHFLMSVLPLMDALFRRRDF